MTSIKGAIVSTVFLNLHGSRFRVQG